MSISIPTELTLETVTRFVLPSPRDGAFFAEGERRTLLAAAEVLLDGVDFSVDDDTIVENIERFVRGSRRAWRVRVLLRIVELAPLLGGCAPFSRLARRDRERFLRDNAFSICGRVRPLVYLGAYSSLMAARRVGWVPVLERERFRRPRQQHEKGPRLQVLR